MAIRDLDDYRCSHCGSMREDVEMRYDYYNIPTRYYCNYCYEHHYPYKKKAYYNYLDAGEYLDDNY